MVARAAIAFLALAGCAPEPTLRKVEADAVTNFVGNTCTDNREDCEFACKDEFWFPEAETHLNQCLLIEAHYRIPESASKKRKAAMLAGEEYPTKKPDIDNIVKNILDALNVMAWADDAQVVSLIVSKVWSDNPRVEVAVEPFRAVATRRAAA